MITYFTSNCNNDIYNSLPELLEKDCTKDDGLSMKIFHKKKDWHLHNCSLDYRNSLKNSKTERITDSTKIKEVDEGILIQNTHNTNSRSNSRTNSRENSHSRNRNNSRGKFKKLLNNIPNRNDKQQRSTSAESSK